VYVKIARIAPHETGIRYQEVGKIQAFVTAEDALAS